MGKIDGITKKYMRQNDRFADMCNFYLFDGESVVKADDLEEKDITELEIFRDKDNKVISVQKLRDILKRCVVKSADGVTYMIIGIENQTDINYAMVIKNMVYDALNYASQAEEYAKKHREDKDLKGAEFLSGFAKNNKLVPVITITIYWGAGEWDGSRSLHDMLDIKNKELLEYVPNYWLNLVVPNDIVEFSKFKTELGKVMSFINCSEDKEEIKRRFLESENSEYSKLSIDAITLLNECINTDINISEEEGDEADVCKGIKDLMEEAREEGREEGADRLAVLIKYLSKDNRKKEKDKILSDKQLREQLYSEYNL